jgi:hypothetical protein
MSVREEHADAGAAEPVLGPQQRKLTACEWMERVGDDHRI